LAQFVSLRVEIVLAYLVVLSTEDCASFGLVCVVVKHSTSIGLRHSLQSIENKNIYIYV